MNWLLEALDSLIHFFRAERIGRPVCDAHERAIWAGFEDGYYCEHMTTSTPGVTCGRCNRPVPVITTTSSGTSLTLDSTP